MKLLGIDPGKKTGLALLDGERVVWTKTCDEYDLLRHLLDAQAFFEGVAVEWWEYQGAKRAQGCAFQAGSAGYATGLAEGVGATVVKMTRTSILKALGLKRNAAKAVVRQHVRALTRGDRPNNEHEADAIAVALAAAGRFDGPQGGFAEGASQGQRNRKACR